MNKFFLLFILLPLRLFPQISITGTVIEEETKQAVAYATVYINGTTHGTITDARGSYNLNKITLPAQLIVSHVAYRTVIFDLKDSAPNPLILNIPLKKAENKINEIQVQGKNGRQNNLRYFFKYFLGEGKWGEYAFLENDTVLRFYSEEKYVDDGYFIQYKRDELFIAFALSPLYVKLPLLGYELHINMENFKVEYLPEMGVYETNCQGYIYFKPLEIDSKFKQKKIAHNRLKAYYNSKSHFLKALQSNSLKENGYLITTKHFDPYLNKFYYDEAKIDTCFEYHENYVDIIGLKGKGYKVGYFKNLKGHPLNLNKYKRNYSQITGIYFKSDTCRVYKNGIVSDQSILFGPQMGDKKVGAALPEDFDPKNPLK